MDKFAISPTPNLPDGLTLCGEAKDHGKSFRAGTDNLHEICYK